MSFQPSTTSDLRRVLCQRMCQVVYSGEAELKAWFAGELDRFPFERRSDDQLIALARQMLDDAAVDDIVSRNSAFRYATTAAAPLLGERTTL